MMCIWLYTFAGCVIGSCFFFGGGCCNKSIGRSKSLFDNEGRFSRKVLPPRVGRGSICVSGKDIDCCGQDRARVQLIQRNQRFWFRQLNGLMSRTSVAHRFCTYGWAGSDLSYIRSHGYLSRSHNGMLCTSLLLVYSRPAKTSR